MTDSNPSPVEQFSFKAETKQLLNILIHSLYKEREVFLNINFRINFMNIGGDQGNYIGFTRLRRIYKICDDIVKCVSEDKERENRNKPQGG